MEIMLQRIKGIDELNHYYYSASHCTNNSFDCIVQCMLIKLWI